MISAIDSITVRAITLTAIIRRRRIVLVNSAFQGARALIRDYYTPFPIGRRSRSRPAQYGQRGQDHERQPDKQPVAKQPFHTFF